MQAALKAIVNGPGISPLLSTLKPQLAVASLSNDAALLCHYISLVCSETSSYPDASCAWYGEHSVPRGNDLRYMGQLRAQSHAVGTCSLKVLLSWPSTTCPTCKQP